jgi:uncharacterized membrane protein
MAPSPSSPSPQALPAGHGWTWLVRGWGLFAKDPLTWVLFILVLAVIAVAIMLVPILGPFAWSVIGPVFSAGLLYAAHQADQGAKPEIGHLFQGFREPGRLAPLLTLGAMVLTASLVARLLTPDLNAMLSSAAGLESVAPAELDSGVLSGLLVLTLIELLILMALFFAVPLVMFAAVPPLDAVKSSLAACLKNVLPLTVFGLVGTVLFILALLPMGLGLLILMPVSVAASYYAYLEVYDIGTPSGGADNATARIEA